MVKTHTTIELNGKRYDASSGQILKQVTPNPKTSKKHVSENTHLDGIHMKSRSSHHSPKKAAHSHHKTERSHTLMRAVVKKPAESPKESFTRVQRPKSRSGHDAARIQHALEIPKSPKISKFGLPRTKVRTVTKVLPVKEPPVSEPTVLYRSYASTLAVNPFSKAIESATAHTLPKLKKPSLKSKTARRLKVSTKIVNLAASSLVVVVLGGFIAYQNIPNLSLRVAAAKAGVTARLPGYQPSGFSLRGPIQANAGQVTLTYRSNTDDRKFDVTQRSSAWDNQSLIKNHVAVKQRPYQTLQSENKTIYMYDGGKATWVDRGVWFQIDGGSVLNSDQLLRIAASL